MANNVHTGHRQRLRETMQVVGMENMQEHQVLEYLLSFVVAQRDTNPTAHNLINHFGSFGAVLEASVEELESVQGVGKVTATFLHTFLKFYDYYLQHKPKKIDCINNSMMASMFASSVLKSKLTEQFYCALLDPQGYVITYKKMAEGSKSKLNVFIRDITKFALSHNATQVLVCHNHPDADSSPSAEDEEFTENLKLALIPNGIKMMDHVIVGKDDYYSFHVGYKYTDEQITEFLKNTGRL